MNEKTISKDGLTLSYFDEGKGGVPYIFIHGFPFNKTSWLPQLNHLSKTHRVVAFDLRGYGGSVYAGGELSMDVFADDLIFLMDSLDIDKAVVCGLSMGGYIALNAIGRYNERFAGVILCDTQCTADTPEGKANRYRSIELIDNGGIADFRKTFINNLFGQWTLANNSEIVESVKQIVGSADAEIVKKTLAALAERKETCSLLGSINVPALIICGKEDKITPPEKAIYLQEHIEGSELYLIENAGHLSNLEQINRFNQALERLKV